MISEDKDFEPKFSELHQQIQNAIGSRDYKQVEGSIDELFELAVESCVDDPTPDFELTIAAGECEEQGDWGGVEAAYKQILKLPDGEPHTRYQALSELAGLYRLFNRKSEALSHASLAVAAAREEDLPVLLAVSLGQQAALLIHYDRTSDARPCIAEALAEIDQDESCNNIRACLLILLAQCEVNDGQISQAETNLSTALYLFGEWKDFEMAAGVQSDLARWWSVQGMVHSAKESHSKAIEAWQQAVAIRRQIDTLEHCQSIHNQAGIAWMLRGLADELTSAGYTDEAEAAAAEAQAILTKLGIPTE